MAGVPAERSRNEIGARLLLLARRAPGLVAMLLMALLGLGISVYLTVIHYQGAGVAFCSTTGIVNCNKVTSSANSVLFGTNIPITIPGMIWFIVSGGMALVALQAIWQNRREPARLRAAHLLWGVLGMVFVLYLVYAEIVLLRTLCEWCTVIHLLTFATFLLALNRWQQRGLPAPNLNVAPVKPGEGAVSGATGAKSRPVTTASRQPSASNNGVRRAAGNGTTSRQRTRR
jgi:uncharacterized membrane protein